MRFLSVLTFLTFCWIGSALGQSKSSLQEMYTSYLTEKGISAQVDGDGDIEFKMEDNTYYIIIDMDDLDFFRLTMPNIWPIESISEHQQVLQACNAANEKTKVGKAYITNDDVWIASELLVEQPSDFKDIFDRALEELNNCLDNFLGAM